MTRRQFVYLTGWETRPPQRLRMNGRLLDELAERLGGRGAIVRDGFTAKSWGDQAEVSDWLSSAKPVLSTLLFFALEEKKIASVDTRIADCGWELAEKDRGMTFRHVANMVSGYGRPEKPGEAWAYNDYGIMLYQKTLFDRVFREDPETVAKTRFAALGLEDGLRFRASNRRMSASVRDFARIAWFWLNKGEWKGRQVLPRRVFERYQKPQVARDLPQTRKAETDDYLRIGTYGGGSDHFTEYGAGVYGFNWWFNGKGRLHPGALLWPDAPRDAFMSIGAGGNCALMIPSRRVVLVAARANWGKLAGGSREAEMNQYARLLVTACRR